MRFSNVSQNKLYCWVKVLHILYHTSFSLASLLFQANHMVFNRVNAYTLTFGAKFQTTFVVCFIYLFIYFSQTIAWKEVYMYI